MRTHTHTSVGTYIVIRRTYTQVICSWLRPLRAPWYCSSRSDSTHSSPFQYILYSPSSSLLKQFMRARVSRWCWFMRTYNENIMSHDSSSDCLYVVHTSSGISSVLAWMLKNKVMKPLRGFFPRDINVNFNSAPAMGTRRRGWNIQPRKSSLFTPLCVMWIPHQCIASHMTSINSHVTSIASHVTCITGHVTQ